MEYTTRKGDEYYKKMLSLLGSLTRLFAEGNVPYLNYRVTENIFCKAHSAKNLSRSDVSADASLDGVGVGIKTFLEKNSKTMQKVAEFNKESSSFRKLDPKKLILRIANLRNQRIDATMRIHALSKMIYHCIVRSEELIKVFECSFDKIDIDNISNIKASKNTIFFTDGKNEYSFNLTKSTLFKRFITPTSCLKIPVKILEDPFEIIEEKFSEIKKTYYSKEKNRPFVILPLYSPKEKEVQKRSGLNQWNAAGRKRDYDEVYIPIPMNVKKRFPGFFLPRDKYFNLILPNGKILVAKVCQDGGKALMSKHNADLGKWLLREVLDLKKGELLTYSRLQEIGLDSIYLEKIDSKTYSIDFRENGEYEKFLEEHGI